MDRKIRANFSVNVVLYPLRAPTFFQFFFFFLFKLHRVGSTLNSQRIPSILLVKEANCINSYQRKNRSVNK